MEHNPLVSIVMPVYKVENYIRESIQSVIRQTYQNIELILVDDGSPDASIEIAEETLAASQIYCPYRIIRQENAGLGQARNTGMSVAQGNWICFLDSDDLLSDNAIERMITVAASKNVDLVFTEFNIIFDAQDAIRLCPSGEVTYMNAEELQVAFMKRTKVVLAPGSLYKRDFLIQNDLKFERIPWSEDQHFVWRALYHISGAAFVREPLYQYLRHSGSIMAASDGKAMSDSYDRILELSKYYSDNAFIADYIVPRWVMGTMNAGGVLLSWKHWRILWSEIDGRKNFKKLLFFPDIKVKIAACVAYVSPWVYYNLVRKRREK